MRIGCRCSSCGGAYQVEQEYAGRKIRCPKCSAVIVVAAAAAEPKTAAPKVAAPKAPPKPPPGPKPLRVAAKIEPEDSAAEGPGSDEAPEADQSDAVAIPGLEKVASARTALRGGPRKHHGKKKADSSVLWIAGGLIVGAAAIAAAIAWWTLLKMSVPTATSNNVVAATTAPKSNASAKQRKEEAPPAKPSTKLILSWPESERADAVVTIDGDRMAVPLTGPVEYPLEIRGLSHAIQIKRKGFRPLEFSRLSASGEQLPPYPVRWFRSFDAWEQDFEKAKRLAAAGNQRVLIFFDGSDWAANSEPFMRVVFTQESFLSGPGKEYVLVYVDFPHTSEGAANVKDRSRNEALGQQFEVKDYPTVLLTQADGKPIGILSGRLPDHGLKGFLELLKQWRQFGDDVQAAAKEIQAASDPAKKNEAICKAWDLVAGSELEHFYKPQIDQWVAALPADMRNRKHPASEAELHRWAERFERVAYAGRAEAVLATIAEFDQWKATRSFPDKDKVARLHAMAALVLLHSGKGKEAIQKCDEALAYNPSDDELRHGLEQLKEELVENAKGVKGEHLVGRGTGFFVAEGGYLITNHHVIHGQKKLKVRLNSLAEPVPAKLLAADAEVDLALVKVEIPKGVRIVPVPLSSDVKAGQAICVMGYPATGNVREKFAKSPLTITTGVVSGVPDPDDKGAHIELDCRVNPGNSGGPLFNDRGAVVGVIRLKSFSSAAGDSFGYAIPVDRLLAFLKKNLPASASLVAGKGAAAPIEWPQLQEQMTRSVGCVLNYQ